MRHDTRHNPPAPGRRAVRPGRSARRRGILEIDILAGIVIVGALTLALAAVLGRQHRAVQKLADTRAATQVAENTLTDLQSGRGAPKAGGGADVSVQVRSANADAAADASGDAAGSRTWVEVVVSVRGGRASLVGLVPRDAAAAAAAATTGGAP